MRVFLYIFVFLLSAEVRSLVLVSAGPFSNIYNSTRPYDGVPDWYINDHTLIAGPGNTWHLFGITHTEPADPEFETNSAHATSSRLTNFTGQPFAYGSYNDLTRSIPETHFWAPHVIKSESTYYMYYCGGGPDRLQYMINLATSTDLWNWTRRGTLFTAGVDGRDPMVMKLPESYSNAWIMYYCGTSPNQLHDNVSHVTYYRTSRDLINWSEARIAFDGGVTGSAAGGPTESPFVVRRGTNFYLFSGAWSSYSDTRVFLSKSPFTFGSVPAGTAVQVGEMPSHAPEVVRDFDGKWYITRAGWGQGGVYLSPLTWSDHLDKADTSMPPPASTPSQPGNFATNLRSFVVFPMSDDIAKWTITPSGLFGGRPLDNTFYLAQFPINAISDYTYKATISLLTYNGNPTSTPGNWTRMGTGAGLLFDCPDGYNPPDGCYLLNINTQSRGEGQVKLFKFPNSELATYNFSTIALNIPYELAAVKKQNSVEAHLNGQYLFEVSLDTPQKLTYFGVNVWQGSAMFNDLFLNFP